MEGNNSVKTDSGHVVFTLGSPESSFKCPRLAGGNCNCTAYCGEYCRAKAEPPVPQTIAWQHNERPYEVCSDELKQIWLAAKPKHVEHYTIPLCTLTDAQAAANQFFGEYYKNKYELWIAAAQSGIKPVKPQAT